MSRILGALMIPAIGWVAAPIIKAKVDGTPLNALKGIMDYRKAVAMRPVPLWFGITVVIVLVVIAVFVVLKLKQTKRTDLSIVVLPTPKPSWGIGAMGKAARTES